MNYRTLGKTGEKLSEIGLGCMGMSFAYGATDEKENITSNTAVKKVYPKHNGYNTSTTPSSNAPYPSYSKTATGTGSSRGLTVHSSVENRNASYRAKLDAAKNAPQKKGFLGSVTSFFW